MNRDKLEATLDALVSRTLSDEKLLLGIYRQHAQQLESQTPKRDRDRLLAHVEALQGKRGRVIEAFVDGVLNKAERDTRLRALDRDLAEANATLAKYAPAPAWDPKQLAEMFLPFVDWPHLVRAEKRRLLTALAPKFQIAV